MGALVSEIPMKDGTTSVVALYGGAASGKSTLAQQLVAELRNAGHSADVIGTDDYVIGDRPYRREHFERKEPRAKYDFDLLNQKIREICALEDGQTVGVPTYDEETGVAIAAGEENFEHQIGKVDVLFIEGDFPEVEDPALTVFLHVSDEQRLQQRIARDALKRGEADEAKTTENFWQRHETQHLPITIGAIEHADVIVEGTIDQDRRHFDIYHAKPEE